MADKKKYLCINDKFHGEAVVRIPNRPKKGLFYTIREEIIIVRKNNQRAYLLEEIVNPELRDPVHNGFFEPSFHSSRFKVVDSEKLSEVVAKENTQPIENIV